MTELVFILDRSGSMSGLESDVIGGFNSMIKDQRTKDDDAVVSTVIFDNYSDVIHDRVPLDKIEPLTEKEYFVRGSTALLDAVGDAIKHIGNIHKYARKEDIPEKTIFVINTDGYENASQKYSYADIKKEISRQTEKYGWEFMFLGANIDAEAEGERIGIRRSRSVRYNADSMGTQVNYRTVNKAIHQMRDAAYCIARDDESWKEDILEDLKRTEKKKK